MTSHYMCFVQVPVVLADLVTAVMMINDLPPVEEVMGMLQGQPASTVRARVWRVACLLRL